MNDRARMKLVSLAIVVGIAVVTRSWVSSFIKRLRQEAEASGKDCPLIKTKDKIVYSVIYVTVALCFPFAGYFGEQTIVCRVLFIGAYFSLMYHYFVVRARLHEKRERTVSNLFEFGGGLLGNFFINSIFCIFALLFYAWERKWMKYEKNGFFGFLFRNCFFAYCGCLIWMSVLWVLFQNACS